MSNIFNEDREPFEGDYRIIDHKYIERDDARASKRSLYDDGLRVSLPENQNLNMIDYKLPVSSSRDFDKNTIDHETITHAELSSLRRLAAFAIPNVEPPITDEEIQQLGRATVSDVLTQRLLDRINGKVVDSRTIPQAPELVAVIEAAKGFRAKQDSLDLRSAASRTFETWFGGNDGIHIGVGRTALFEVTPFERQEQMIQGQIDALVEARQPVEG